MCGPRDFDGDALAGVHDRGARTPFEVLIGDANELPDALNLPEVFTTGDAILFHGGG